MLYYINIVRKQSKYYHDIASTARAEMYGQMTSALGNFVHRQQLFVSQNQL